MHATDPEPRPATHPQPSRPVMVGEVLFDVFPDGRAVLGGAPFNVAWHLHGFGLAPLFVSRVGRDARGDEVIAAMTTWGLDTSALQVDPERPTGRVEIALEGVDASYRILPDQAYDHIALEAIEACLAGLEVSLLYHGSLLARTPAGAATVAALVERLGAPVFMDVNLRPPWWNAQELDAMLARARWVKLNEQELATLMPAGGSLQDAALQLCRRHGLRAMVVTRGAEGATWVEARQSLEGHPAPVAALVDTVGAGDAFSAVSIAGLLRSWPADVLLDRALAFAAEICTRRGAVQADPDLYARHLAAWATGDDPRQRP